MQEMSTCPLGICPHYSSCWECCLQMALSHQPRVEDSLRRGGHTPFLGHQVCAMMTDGCRTLQDQL